MDTATSTTADQFRRLNGLPEAGDPLSLPAFTPTVAISAVARSRFARDLHDSVGQSLFALLVEIRVALDRGEAGRDVLLLLEREAQNALQSVRTLAYRVRRSRSAEDPLVDAQEYGTRLLGSAGRVFRWNDFRENPQLGSRVARALAWSIREAITNAVRHGAAASVEVRLVDAGGRIQATIRDDGAGFVLRPLHVGVDGRGLGLLGSAERMAEVGGKFTIRSRPGEGTLVVLEAPRHLRPPTSPQSVPSVQLRLDASETQKTAAAVNS